MPQLRSLRSESDSCVNGGVVDPATSRGLVCPRILQDSDMAKSTQWMLSAALLMCSEEFSSSEKHMQAGGRGSKETFIKFEVAYNVIYLRHR